MKLIICKDYGEVSKNAADIAAEQIKANPKSVLGFATGSTPIGMYGELVKMYQNGEIDFCGVQSFNLDEYYPISPDNEQSYHYFMNDKLFSKVNIKKENTYILDGMCDDAKTECENFEKLIEEKGGIDLQILGIGQNGHIGFNEPSGNLSSLTHLVELTQSTIDTNSRFFGSADEVPKKALTMGMGSILKARKIILLACGASKHNDVKTLLSDCITTEIPATMLKMHRDVTLICDNEAYSGRQ